MLLMVQIDNSFISAKWKGVFCYYILNMFAKYDNSAIECCNKCNQMSHNYILWPVAKVWLPWLPSYDLIGWFCLYCQGSSIRSPNMKSIHRQKIKL